MNGEPPNVLNCVCLPSDFVSSSVSPRWMLRMPNCKSVAFRRDDNDTDKDSRWMIDRSISYPAPFTSNGGVRLCRQCVAAETSVCDESNHGDCYCIETKLNDDNSGDENGGPDRLPFKQGGERWVFHSSSTCFRLPCGKYLFPSRPPPF